MSDKELIKQEIEKRLSSLWDLIPEGEKVLKDDFTKEDANNLGKYTELESLLQFIDSLPEESASEDLEIEIDNYFKDWTFDDEMSVMVKPNHYFAEFNDIKEIAHHFAEWQREKNIKLEKIDDLEEFAQKWAYSNYHKELDGVNCDCLYSGVKKGAEWQKQQMKEALQTEYEKGRFDMREEIMKDAVEGEVYKGYVGNQIVVSSKDGSSKYVAFDASYADAFCVGDKVKIIIVKEEQQ